MLFLKDTLSMEDEGCLFHRAITSKVPPPKVHKVQHFITIVSLTISGISLLSCIYVLGHK